MRISLYNTWHVYLLFPRLDRLKFWRGWLGRCVDIIYDSYEAIKERRHRVYAFGFYGTCIVILRQSFGLNSLRILPNSVPYLSFISLQNLAFSFYVP